ncbi:hypothetical protein OP10G_3957 [Fimbriimonas ginsengisoli Gsoil 348]|uniref:Uncharacterized protein n=1 Tax=Fimbriimonas ginsengisoli Gsoil 348 TaxID=661478 RepID=A0A068NX12_FIMGI|nr:hypothetical protein OP10G_3957 [Fimbriimonas ginsengisoli Gsoil 348]
MRIADHICFQEATNERSGAGRQACVSGIFEEIAPAEHSRKCYLALHRISHGFTRLTIEGASKRRS